MAAPRVRTFEPTKKHRVSLIVVHKDEAVCTSSVHEYHYGGELDVNGS